MSDAGAADGVGVRLIPKDPVEAAPTGPMEQLPDQSLVQGRRVPVAGQRNRRNSQTDTKEDHASWILSIEKADATQNQAAAKIQGLYRMMKGKARVSNEWPQLYTVYWSFVPSSVLAPRPSPACWLAWSQLRIRIRHLFEKHYDEHSGYHYYVHKKTGESTWQKPLLLGAEDLDDGKDVEPPKGSFVRSFVVLSSCIRPLGSLY